MAVQSFDQFICLNGVVLEDVLVVIHSNCLTIHPIATCMLYAHMFSSNKIGCVIKWGIFPC